MRAPAVKAAAASDEQLVEAVARGEAQALGELYRRYATMVGSAVSRHVPGLSNEDIEDVCQEVFLAMREQATRYRECGKLRSYLLGIGIRMGKAARRRRLVRSALLGRFWHRAEPGAPHTPAAGLHLDMDLALAKLPQAQRDVLLLQVCENLTTGEIAMALGIREKTVWTRLHRARKTLLGVLEGESISGRQE